VVDAVIAAQSESSKADVAAWKQEVPFLWWLFCKLISSFVQIVPCEHVLLLHQDANAQKLGSREMSHCGMCDLPNNLWLCLTCGHLGCGRQQMEIGTQINLGGNGHALAHHEATGHPVAVKTGTISPNGTADTWCYSCYFGSGNDIIDPKLSDHLKHFGIDLATQSKTEKTIAEMTLEQNLKLSFFRFFFSLYFLPFFLCPLHTHCISCISSSKENGVIMKPLYGPGLTGLINIGNSCYMASVLQCLSSIPEFQQRYYPGLVLLLLLVHLFFCFQNLTRS
jgi:ubiquitin carboxyl-terminal hydrolase 5/13